MLPKNVKTWLSGLSQIDCMTFCCAKSAESKEREKGRKKLETGKKVEKGGERERDSERDGLKRKKKETNTVSNLKTLHTCFLQQ